MPPVSNYSTYIIDSCMYEGRNILMRKAYDDYGLFYFRFFIEQTFTLHGITVKMEL